MPNNLILPFAQGTGANTPSDAAWATDSALAQGFQTGVAKSASVNKALRQSTAVASGFGQFTADFGGFDFSDSLTPAQVRDNFRQALAAALDGARMGIDTSGVTNQITFSLTPLPATLSGLKVIYFRPAITNTGAATAQILKSDGTAAFPAISIKRRDGQDPQAGDLVAGVWYGSVWNGTTAALLAVTKSEIAAQIAAAGGGGGGSGGSFANNLFTATQTANQSLPLNTETTLNFQSPAAGAISGIGTWNGNTLTVNTACRLLVYAAMPTTFGGNGQVEATVYITKNNADLVGGDSTNNGTSSAPNVTTIVDMAINDTLKIRGIASGGSSASTQYVSGSGAIGTIFQVLRLS